jgi:hypothetical protein
MTAFRFVLVLLLLAATPVFAQRGRAQAQANTPIEGVQAASLDQPRIYMHLKRSATGEVLSTGGREAASGIEAFLDTGASGVSLSTDTVKHLGVERATIGNRAVSFFDIGIGGEEKFGVTEPLFAAFAPYPRSDPEDVAIYGEQVGPLRMQIRPRGGLIELIAPGMDIVGMPAMAGKVMVMDPRPLADFDKIRTALVSPNDARIPRTTSHVPLTYVDFGRFTRLDPPTAQGPAVHANPMIGPDPFVLNDRSKPVILRHGGRSASATILLDTGAAASLISSELAKKLGIEIGRGNRLPNVPQEDQFSLAIGGIGGAKQASGLFFDRLELPTREGPPIIFARAPMLIVDIAVTDQRGQSYTLDGVLGMNFLVASAEVSGGMLPDIGRIVDGPFRWIVIDHHRKVMGVEPRQ